MKLTEPKPTEKSSKKLKLSIFNIKSLLVFNKKKLDKIKKEKKKFSLFQMKKKKVEEKENKIESPRTVGSTLKSIGKGLLAKPLSIIDKLKEFFGIILLGILVNNLPTIVKKLQQVLGKIKKFFEDNPWIGKTITFVFGIIAKGMMGILDLTKALMPIIGGSFKFALDTIRLAGREIGKAITLFDQLGAGINSVMNAFGYKPPAKAAQAYAASKGKYYSSTTGKTYANYKTALKDPKVSQGAQQQQQAIQQKAQKAQAGTSAAIQNGYDPNKGTVGLVSKKNVVMASFRGQMGIMDPNDKTGTPDNAPESFRKLNQNNTWKPHIERYQAVNQAQKVQKFASGGTVRNFFGNMFGSRRGLGNIPPQEGTGRGGPSDIRMATKDSGQSYASPYASPGGTAKGRKARETVNYFKFFENNVKNEERNLIGEEKNLTMFSEFMKSYNNLLDIRKKYKYGEEYNEPGPTPPGDTGPPLINGEVYLASGGILPSTKPGRGNRGLKGDHKYPARDYQIEAGQPISVFVPGVVDFAGNQNPTGYGNEIIIKHSNGTMTQYAHLSEILVRKGDVIEPGESRVIGKTGGVTGAPGSGNSRGEHLHFELRDSTGKKITTYNSGDNYFRFGGNITVKKQKPARTPGANNLEIARNFFRGMGLNEIAVAGILGNGQIESGFNPTIAHSQLYQGKNPKFIGIFQWKHDDRWVNLTNFAKENKMNREDIQTQLLFTAEEMRVGSKYYDSGAGQAYQKLLAGPKTPEEAAKIWHELFERASADSPPREKAARDIYKKYKDKPVATAPGALPISSAQQAQTEADIIKLMNSMGVTEKFFPQDNQKIKIVRGADGKEKIQVIDTGLFNLGIGGGILPSISPQTWKKLKNYLQYEYNKKQEEKNKPGPSSSSYGGANASVTIIDRPTVAVVEKVIPQVIPGPTQIVPILISQGTSASRILRFNLS